MRNIIVVPLLLAACGKAEPGFTRELSTAGSVEVTARLVEIRGELPRKKLYDYVYVLKYRVLKVHRGKADGDEIFVGQYNPLKPRAAARDKFVKDVCGNLDRFEPGDVHRMALAEPLNDLYMGGIIDKYFQEKGTRYWAICTDRARE